MVLRSLRSRTIGITQLEAREDESETVNFSFYNSSCSKSRTFSDQEKMVFRSCIVLAAAGTAAAFAPSAVPAIGLRSTAQVSRRATASVGPKMVADPSVISDAIQHLSTMETIPFIDEVTGDPQGFTAPVNHFGSVSCGEQKGTG